MASTASGETLLAANRSPFLVKRQRRPPRGRTSVRLMVGDTRSPAAWGPMRSGARYVSPEAAGSLSPSRQSRDHSRRSRAVVAEIAERAAVLPTDLHPDVEDCEGPQQPFPGGTLLGADARRQLPSRGDGQAQTLRGPTLPERYVPGHSFAGAVRVRDQSERSSPESARSPLVLTRRSGRLGGLDTLQRSRGQERALRLVQFQ
jgi:hypothetical protein